MATINLSTNAVSFGKNSGVYTRCTSLNKVSDVRKRTCYGTHYRSNKFFLETKIISWLAWYFRTFRLDKLRFFIVHPAYVSCIREALIMGLAKPQIESYTRPKTCSKYSSGSSMSVPTFNIVGMPVCPLLYRLLSTCWKWESVLTCTSKVLNLYRLCSNGLLR